MDDENGVADDTPTCGDGLAANSALPAKLAEWLSARAEVLERHVDALDPADARARLELDAYTRLARAHRDVGSQLSTLAEQMASYRDLPVAPHDTAVMADPAGQAAAYRRFVAVERELSALLQTRLAAFED